MEETFAISFALLGKHGESLVLDIGPAAIVGSIKARAAKLPVIGDWLVVGERRFLLVRGPCGDLKTKRLEFAVIEPSGKEWKTK